MVEGSDEVDWVVVERVEELEKDDMYMRDVFH